MVGELKSHKPLGAAGEKKNRLGGKAGREMGDHVSVLDSSSGGKECGKVLDPSQTELAGLADGLGAAGRKGSRGRKDGAQIFV